MIRGFLSSFPVAIAASALSIGLQATPVQATPVQAITTWNWSFTTDISDQYGSGTFTTTDVIPTAFTTYSILDIDGTYSRDGNTYTITGLSNYQDASNTFQWDGTVLSAIFSDYGGFSFDNTGSELVNIYYQGSGSGFNPVDDTVSNFSTPDGVILFSSLNPVPGPLPLFGAAAAYSWSRRLRRRIAEKA